MSAFSILSCHNSLVTLASHVLPTSPSVCSVQAKSRLGSEQLTWPTSAHPLHPGMCPLHALLTHVIDEKSAEMVENLSLWIDHRLPRLTGAFSEMVSQVRLLAPLILM